jgi:FKBP-type peptidyl-prolyl cis-trans isomerase
MATPKSTRIGIWVIAIVMLVGTLGSFLVMILANENAQIDQAQVNKQTEEYQKMVEEENKKAAELSTKYYPVFSEYKNTPAEFDKDAVGDKVTTRDLKEGDGAVLGKETKYQAYYIGWNPRGKSFDSSFEGETLKAPLDTSQMTLITGWNEGVVGMKVGGVREITIPSDLAYGETGSGENIPANTPIKFIVMVIATK